MKMRTYSGESIPYPDWVCGGCGQAYGRGPKTRFSTWHNGVCGVCGKETAVTEPRDFGHFKGIYDPLPIN